MNPDPLLDDSNFADVLARAQQGDAAAMRTLFDDLQPKILRFLAGTEPRGADDIAGDAWVGIATSIASFSGGLAEFRAWVFVIVRRRVSDYRRREAGRPHPPPDEDRFAAVLDAQDTANEIDALSAREAAELLLAMVPPAQAEVLLLRVVVGLEVDQVAQVVGRSANWVRLNQHRALRHLEERLGARRAAGQRLTGERP